jgi:hypothetical protein
MKENFVRFLTGVVVMFAIFALADGANAQRRRESRNRMMTKAQVKAVINRVEDRVDNFTKRFDASLDRSRLNGSTREDWLMNRARDLERATDELSREFDRRDTWAENRDEVRQCLNIATDIDRNMRNYKYGAPAEANWNNVRFELNTLADIYNMPRVGAAAYR